MTDNNLQALVQDFVMRVVTVVETATARRVQAAVLSALSSGTGLTQPRRRGRPPKHALQTALVGTAPLSLGPVRRRAKQFCPVPGCKNVAAPVFGMVCSEHKSVARAKIKKYRQALRADKARTGRA